MRVLVTDLPHAPHAHAGQVLDLPDAEAQDMIHRGTATAAPPDDPIDDAPPTPESAPPTPPAPKPPRTPRAKKVTPPPPSRRKRR
jgi:hypothetical protein